MGKNILEGTTKFYHVGSKGNRIKLVIDDVTLSAWVKEQIETARLLHKVNANKPLQSVQDIIRGEQIEVRLV